MEKKLEDYLHLYLGCDCLVRGDDGGPIKLTGVSYDDTERCYGKG